MPEMLQQLAEEHGIDYVTGDEIHTIEGKDGAIDEEVDAVAVGHITAESHDEIAGDARQHNLTIIRDEESVFLAGGRWVVVSN